ncbi:regulatory protein, Fis family [Nakamurella panacisegetis]|uniref:Regulatory protein, Fis family n=1 Tax=Nakamurella panacisegetis TaxID=1090615 RepID=A0A1H0M2X0_9ACTN|nr:GAF domain-containing protein [Nakamurella panacisegetis]SDO74556.1 regulatory protein, Fis family [Nakamurella panacisegetis]
MTDHRQAAGPAQSGPGHRGVAVASRLRASWQRSEHYGVSPEHVQPVFTGPPDTGSLLYECGSQVLLGLHATLANEPVSLMIADRDGLVLTRLCNDSAINSALDRVYLARGFSFAERHAGTNGLGLALADRAPTLVRAREHYCADLQGYTCAAVPVLDPTTGELAGTVNLTTWADSRPELLLALAQSAASNTAALMLLRATGRRPRPTPRGQVARVWPGRLPAGAGDPCGSAQWLGAMAQAERAMSGGQVVAAIGEPGAGKTTLLSAARRAAAGPERLLVVRPPEAGPLDGWLDLWTPELRHDDTFVLITGAETLPAWTAGELAGALGAAASRPGGPGFAFAATEFGPMPEPLKDLVGTVVEAPALRRRPDDVLPLAQHFARRERHREVVFTPMASKALVAFDWPGNVRQLERVVIHASARTDIVDSQHLPPEVFSGSARPLSRLDNLKRDEIIRCLTEPGATVAGAAAQLGMSRATVYRKIAQYGIKLPRGSA